MHWICRHRPAYPATMLPQKGTRNLARLFEAGPTRGRRKSLSY
jgi:hypothetical protein